MNKISKGKRQLDILLKIFLIVVLFLAAVKLWAAVESPGTPIGSASEKLSGFANCLNKSGAMMYGVDTCEFCQTQKKMFGGNFEKINYINCDFDLELCRQKGITHYPAWEIGGKFLFGIQTFDALSEATGCETNK